MRCRVRRPLSRGILRGMEGASKEWGVSGRVEWILLALSYLRLLWASELFAEDNGRVHTVYCSREKYVAFYAGKRQVKGEDSLEVDAVKVRVRGSTGDQGRKGAVLVRMKGKRDKGGEAVELLQGLYRMHDERSELPLMAWRGYGGWQVWIRGQATRCLRRELSVMAVKWEKKG